jgi:hypothetical protein
MHQVDIHGPLGHNVVLIEDEQLKGNPGNHSIVTKGKVKNVDVAVKQMLTTLEEPLRQFCNEIRILKIIG